jgi:NAD(P)-dependent dehydrogenase (short-subunit alcohol dehydrogenase family)
MSDKGQKVAIITGGSQGIGASLITAYLQRGWSVVATARAPAHLEDNLAAAALQLEQAEIHAITAAASRATQRATQAT